MSDDLKTRLRWAADSSDGCGEWNCDPADLYAAADRIEELEDKLDWVIVERDETFALMLDRAQTAEAKLAKAVEALGFYATLIGEKHECPWHMLSDDFGEKARAALAELGDRDMCKNFTELREGEG